MEIISICFLNLVYKKNHFKRESAETKKKLTSKLMNIDEKNRQKLWIENNAWLHWCTEEILYSIALKNNITIIKVITLNQIMLRRTTLLLLCPGWALAFSGSLFQADPLPILIVFSSVRDMDKVSPMNCVAGKNYVSSKSEVVNK
ncbi:UNVERIFIED_CONTAM: hypothetical protein NCL1_45697 [Trichonephila clavipes]